MFKNFNCPNCGDYDFEIQNILLSYDIFESKTKWKIIIRYKCIKSTTLLTIPVEYFLCMVNMNNKFSEINKIIKIEKNKNEQNVIKLKNFYNEYQTKFFQYEKKLIEKIERLNHKNNNEKYNKLLKLYLSFNDNLLNLLEIYLKKFHFNSNENLNSNFHKSLKTLTSKLNDINKVSIQKQITNIEKGDLKSLFYFIDLTSLPKKMEHPIFILNGHTLPIVGLAHLRNGKILSGSCGILNLWKEEEDHSYKLEKQFLHGINLITSIKELEDNIIIYGCGRTIHEMNVSNYTIINQYNGFNNQIHTIITMRNNTIIIAGGISSEILVWNRHNSNKQKVILSNPQLIFINYIINLNNQDLFASCTTSSRVIIYDLNDNCSVFKEFIEDETHLLCLCNVNKIDFCLSTMNGKIHYYKWNNNEYVKIHTFIGGNHEIYNIIQINNGYLVSVSWDYNIKFWDLENKQLVNCICDENKNTLVIQLKDGRICTASQDKIIKIWNYNLLD